MKSRISIEVDFENGNTPVIQILKDPSDDVRDKLIAFFTEKLGGSSWCKIKWQNTEPPYRIYISPIGEVEEIQKEAEEMIKFVEERK